ncbi:hypothetical protein QUF90_26055 [Desulfococcaceae bacterium HSG9]|nr:hypothetical protein [Desulfococcaceae bacterium HSG9]
MPCHNPFLPHKQMQGYYGPLLGNPEGAIPVYRLYSETLSVHLFTVDENEKNHLMEDEDAKKMWTYEGVAYYAYP